MSHHAQEQCQDVDHDRNECVCDEVDPLLLPDRLHIVSEVLDEALVVECVAHFQSSLSLFEHFLDHCLVGMNCIEQSLDVDFAVFFICVGTHLQEATR